MHTERVDQLPPSFMERPLFRALHYRFAGDWKFAIVELFLFVSCWYFVNGVAMEPVFGRWGLAGEMVFLIVPISWALRTAVVLRNEHRRLQSSIRSVVTRKSRLWVWAMRFRRMGSAHKTLRGWFEWTATILDKHPDPEREVPPSELRRLLYREAPGRWRLWIGGVLIVTFVFLPACIGELIAQWRRGTTEQTYLLSGQTCTRLNACESLVLTRAPTRYFDVQARGDGSGRVCLAFDTDPRTWRIVRFVSRDGNVMLRLHDGGTAASEVVVTLYGRSVEVFYDFANMNFQAAIEISLTTRRGQPLEQGWLVLLRNAPGTTTLLGNGGC